MRNFINLADIDKKDLREIIDRAKLEKNKRLNLPIRLLLIKTKYVFNLTNI